jgi:hypothetical protein
MTKVIIAFRSFTNAPKNEPWVTKKNVSNTEAVKVNVARSFTEGTELKIKTL